MNNIYVIVKCRSDAEPLNLLCLKVIAKSSISNGGRAPRCRNILVGTGVKLALRESLVMWGRI